jgi:hypothetical protein
MHFSTKTKLKSMESTLPYTGNSDQKGFSDEVIATTVVYEGDDMVINGKGVKCGDKLEVISYFLFHPCKFCLRTPAESSVSKMESFTLSKPSEASPALVFLSSNKLSFSGILA